MIYIPIWLDLLLTSALTEDSKIFDLHSNMVRFIIKWNPGHMKLDLKFTFQYG